MKQSCHFPPNVLIVPFKHSFYNKTIHSPSPRILPMESRFLVTITSCSLAWSWSIYSSKHPSFSQPSEWTKWEKSNRPEHKWYFLPTIKMSTHQQKNFCSCVCLLEICYMQAVVTLYFPRPVFVVVSFFFKLCGYTSISSISLRCTKLWIIYFNEL